MAQTQSPVPQVAPPQPAPVAMLKVLKQDYRDWIAAGGTPPIYGNVPPPLATNPPQ